MTRTLLIAGFASLFMAVGAHGQKKSEPPADTGSFFSSDSNLVLVDSIVTDKKGAYIDDLTRSDFTVREDGRQQTLASFSHVADGSPDTEKHYLVPLFDDSTVPRVAQQYARDAAVRFIGSNAGPERYMAVAEWNGVLRVTQNLTDNADKLQQAVNAAKFSPVSTVPQPGALPAALRNLAQGLARVPGRKTVLLFSEGTLVTPEQMQTAIDECNRANVAIYPVDIRALPASGLGGASVGNASLGRQQLTYSPPQSTPAARQALVSELNALATQSAPESAPDLLSGLAAGTGGFVVSGSGNLPDDLDRIAKEESQYYALGYAPAKASKPGACHKIKVDVDREGANVRARTGYCDAITPDIQTGTPTERELEARLNGNEPPTVHATLQTSFFYVAPNTARVQVAMDIPGAAVKFVKDNGRFAAALNIIGIAYLPDGGVAARFSDTARIALNDRKAVEEFAARPYHYEKQFEIASGAFELKLAFSSSVASFGKIESALTIDPWTPSKFLLSGLALSQSIRPAAAAPGDEADLFGEKVPLTFKGIQLIPAGTNRLRKSEKAYVYAQLYEPALSASADVRLTLLDAKTGKLVKDAGISKVTRETAEGAAVAPLGMILPVADLAPGSYVAEVTAQDAAGDRSTRNITFELAP